MDLAEGMAFVNNMKIKADTGIIEKNIPFSEIAENYYEFPTFIKYIKDF